MGVLSARGWEWVVCDHGRGVLPPLPVNSAPPGVWSREAAPHSPISTVEKCFTLLMLGCPMSSGTWVGPWVG